MAGGVVDAAFLFPRRAVAAICFAVRCFLGRATIGGGFAGFAVDVVVDADREVRSEREVGQRDVAVAATRSDAEWTPGSSSTSRLAGMTVDSMCRRLRKGGEYQCQLRRSL